MFELFVLNDRIGISYTLGIVSSLKTKEITEDCWGADSPSILKKARPDTMFLVAKEKDSVKQHR